MVRAFVFHCSCQKGNQVLKLLLKHLRRRFIVEYPTRIFVYPAFHPLYFLFCCVCEIKAFRIPPPNHCVLILIASPLPATISMTKENLCPHPFRGQRRPGNSHSVRKFRTIINRDRFEYLSERLPALLFQIIQRRNNTFHCFSRHQN